MVRFSDLGVAPLRVHPYGIEELFVDIKVGIQHVNREIAVDSPDTAESVEKAFAAAIADGGMLTLTDARGRKVLIPATAIGYLDIGEENARHVGFSV